MYGSQTRHYPLGYGVSLNVIVDKILLVKRNVVLIRGCCLISEIWLVNSLTITIYLKVQNQIFKNINVFYFSQAFHTRISWHNFNLIFHTRISWRNFNLRFHTRISWRNFNINVKLTTFIMQ